MKKFTILVFYISPDGNLFFSKFIKYTKSVLYWRLIRWQMFTRWRCACSSSSSRCGVISYVSINKLLNYTHLSLLSPSLSTTKLKETISIAPFTIIHQDVYNWRTISTLFTWWERISTASECLASLKSIPLTASIASPTNSAPDLCAGRSGCISEIKIGTPCSLPPYVRAPSTNYSTAYINSIQLTTVYCYYYNVTVNYLSFLLNFWLTVEAGLLKWLCSFTCSDLCVPRVATDDVVVVAQQQWRRQKNFADGAL